MNDLDTQVMEDDNGINKMVMKFIRLREQSQAHDMFFRLRYMNNQQQQHQNNNAETCGRSTTTTTSTMLQRMLEAISNNGGSGGDVSSDDNDEDEFAKKPPSSSHSKTDRLRAGGLLYSKAWKETSFHEANTWKAAWHRITTELDDIKITEIEKYLDVYTQVLRVSLNFYE